MKLTGKAREAFERWVINNYGLPYNVDRMGIFDNDDNYLREPLVNALIVEFLDEQGIFIQHFNSDGSLGREFDADISYKGKMHFTDSPKMSRQEAISAAIEKANEILNQRLKWPT